MQMIVDLYYNNIVLLARRGRGAAAHEPPSDQCHNNIYLRARTEGWILPVDSRLRNWCVWFGFSSGHREGMSGTFFCWYLHVWPFPFKFITSLQISNSGVQLRSPSVPEIWNNRWWQVVYCSRMPISGQSTTTEISSLFAIAIRYEIWWQLVDGEETQQAKQWSGDYTCKNLLLLIWTMI